MEQLEFFVVPSPCVGICTVDDKGYCHGCMRKREERFRWLEMSPSEQLHVIKLCRQRYRRKKFGKPTPKNKEHEEQNTQPGLFDDSE